MSEMQGMNGTEQQASGRVADCPGDLSQRQQVENMVRDLIVKVADRWTMLAMEALEEHGRVRFTQLRSLLEGVSQKMLTKTLRQMECDGLVRRFVHPVIPPHVEYELTDLGLSLGEAFCPLWRWVQAHHGEVEEARRRFSGQHPEGHGKPLPQ